MKYKDVRTREMRRHHPKYNYFDRFVKKDLTLPTPRQIAQAVAKAINGAPEKFNMCDWHSTPSRRERRGDEPNTCGTQHCLAGWVSLLFNPDCMKNIRLEVQSDRGKPTWFRDPAEEFAYDVLNPSKSWGVKADLEELFHDTCVDRTSALERFKEIVGRKVS